MNQEQNVSLETLHRALESKKQINNLAATIEMLWQGGNLYYTKNILQEKIPSDDLEILRNTFNDFIKNYAVIFADIENSLNISE